MKIAAGPEMGDFRKVRDIPDGSIEVTYIAQLLIEKIEDIITDLCRDAERSVCGNSLHYTDGDDNTILYIRPKEKSLRLLFDGRLETFPDDHGFLRSVAPEHGNDNVEFELKNTDFCNIARDYVIIALSRNDYFAPPEHDQYEDDEYVIELTNGKYEGRMVDGKPCGKGKFTWDDGTVYEGTIVNGQVTGSGTLTRTNGDVFKARFVNGKATQEKEEKEERPKPPEPKSPFLFGYIG